MSTTSDTPGPGRRLHPKLPERFHGHSGVWVFVELERGHVHPVSWELMGEGRKLARELGVALAALVLGPPGEPTDAAVDQAFGYGADLVHLCVDPVLGDYRNAPYAHALSAIVEAAKPEILLLGATPLGRDLAGAVATSLQTGLTADCTELAIDADQALAATRPTFGGSLLCTIYTLKVRPQMATVRPRVMAMPEPEAGRTGRIVRHELGLVETDVVTKVLDFVADASTGDVALAYADVVVAGGMGLQSAANFELVRRLAAVLGGDYGCSRPVAQKGWLPAERQIGQTGRTIRPRLYIAAGISGAVQHRVGVEGADLIVAINLDADAPIFDFAHVGVVADALQVLPALTDAVARRLGQPAMAS